MNEETLITMGDKSLSLDGWRLTPTSAVVVGKMDVGAFRRAFRFLHATTGFAAWWWGDVLLAYCEFEKKDGAAYAHYAREWEEIVGVAAGTLQHYCGVARAFKPCSRLQGLSWNHHHEIWSAGITDEHEMQDWLTQAEANKWSKTTLRAQLRAHKHAQADGAGDGGQPVVVTQSELFAAKRWARAQLPRIEQMGLDEIRSMRSDIAPMVALDRALEQAEVARVAKESLSAAA